MEIIERIYKLLDEKGLRASDLCVELEIRQSTMSTWKSHKNDPPAKYMPTIAKFLGVSLDYLLSGESAPAVRYTSEEEDELLELYRQLPMNKRYEFVGELKGFLRALADNKKYLDEGKRLSV